MDFFISAFPIALLIYLMVKPNGMPSAQALPLVAVVLYLSKLVYFGSDPNEVHANVLSGLLTAWTPILIVWGAILLFRTMEYSGGMDVIRSWLNSISKNQVAQLMIVGWAFPFLIEGASGFGTPAALAAPILVGLGFPAVRVAILCLVMNSVPVSFGAVGTPTWFGFKEIALNNSELMSVAIQSAWIQFFAALVIPVFALAFLVERKRIQKNLVYVFLSILSCTIPMVALSYLTYEFPSIIGGAIGFIVSVIIAKLGIGLEKAENEAENEAKDPVTYASLIRATFPLWGSILLLVITRIQQIGIKSFLNDSTPFVTIELGSLGSFGLSPSLVLSLNSIFETSANWSHKLLYVPSIIPFLAVAVLGFLWYRMPFNTVAKVFKDTNSAMAAPVVALLGALVFVKLLMMDGDRANSMIIGYALADLFGSSWHWGAPIWEPWARFSLDQQPFQISLLAAFKIRLPKHWNCRELLFWRCSL
jgi:lactate permease